MLETVIFITFFAVGWWLLSPAEKRKTFNEEKNEVIREGYFKK